jgi:hypothetical protein
MLDNFVIPQLEFKLPPTKQNNKPKETMSRSSDARSSLQS